MWRRCPRRPTGIRLTWVRDSTRGRELLPEFEPAIDELESGLRACPEDRWEAPLWRVRLSDPWMLPRRGVVDGSRTEEAIQVFSAFWMVAYHCLHFLDFYLWDGSGSWRPPVRFIGGPEDQPIGDDGAAPLPSQVYTRDDLLGYLAYCRTRARAVFGGLTESQLPRRCGPQHPHRGKTFEELLQVNLAHLREHAQQLAGAASL
jgi:hypothetical protein